MKKWERRSREYLVGWQDIDLAGRPHFPNYFLWVSRVFDEVMTEAGVDWLQWVRKFRLGTPIIHVECDYLSPLSLHDRIGIGLEFKKVTVRGFEVHFSMWKADDSAKKEVARGLIRRRFVDLDGFQSLEAPPEVLRIFQLLAER